MNGSISQPDLKYLYAISGGQCAKCKISILRQGVSGKIVLIAETSHIRGKKPKALRHDFEYPTEKLNDQSNLIILCPNCHTEIDKNEEDYSVDKLLAIKKEHEDDVLYQKRGLSVPEQVPLISSDLSVVRIREPPKTLSVERLGVKRECNRWLIVDDHIDSKTFVKEMKSRIQGKLEATCHIHRAAYDWVLYRLDQYQNQILPSSNVTYPIDVSTQIKPISNPSGFEFMISFPRGVVSGSVLDSFMGLFFSNNPKNLEPSSLLRNGSLTFSNGSKPTFHFKLELNLGTSLTEDFITDDFRSFNADVEELVFLNGTKMATIRFDCSPSQFDQHLQFIGLSQLRDETSFLDFGWDYEKCTLGFWIPFR